FEPARSPFALFADAAYGRSEVDARACDAAGAVCDGGTSDLDALQVSLGVAARLTSPTSPYALRLHLGGNLTHLRVDDGVERFGYDNPGLLAGLSLEVPLWETVGVKLSGMNSFIRTDTRSLERDLAEPGETASLEDKWANVFRFGVGIRIGY
ncbi:MAG TPA: hypothetical protein VNA89_16295, partial [Gemmatimonadaceae bacterium]|nr:hypothetical protein [Gemmatimonadaceae bacterium]